MTLQLDTLGDTRVLLPGDDGYARASTAFARVGRPAVVVQPADADEAAAAVVFARDNGLTLSVRSGGHSGSGHSTNDDGLVLDLALLDTVEVLPGDLVRIGGGATWGTVASALGDYDLAITSGDTASVGVGGLTLGGGIGWLVREYGLALDNLVAAEVVTADGQILGADESENPDLFWALRGGGGNFGVVTSFTFRASPLDGIHFGTLEFASDDLAALLTGWRDVMRAAPERLGSTFLSMPPFGDMPGGVQIIVCYGASDDDAAAEAIAPLLALGGLTGNTIARTSYSEILGDAHAPEGVRIVNNNAFAPDLSDACIRAVAEMYSATPGSVLMVRYLGGAFNRVDRDATAVAFRDSETLIISAAFFPHDAGDDAVEAYQQRWDSLLPYLQGLYGNFSALASDVATPLMYPPDTLARLERIKSVYDPQNLFDQNHNIRPTAADWR